MVRRWIPSRGIGVVMAGVAMTLCGGATASQAASLRTKLACASDYYSYCSQHSADGQAVRQYFRDNGVKLSRRCVLALIADGEVSREEVLRRAAAAGISVR